MEKENLCDLEGLEGEDRDNVMDSRHRGWNRDDQRYQKMEMSLEVVKKTVEDLKAKTPKSQWPKVLNGRNIARHSGTTKGSIYKYLQMIYGKGGKPDIMEELPELEELPDVKAEVFEDDYTIMFDEEIDNTQPEEKKLTRNDFRYLATLADNFKRQGNDYYLEGRFKQKYNSIYKYSIRV